MDKTSYEIRLKQWIDIIQETNASGMAKGSWCEQNGISLRQFYYWQKKVRDCAIAQAASETAAVHHNKPLLLEGKGNELPVFCELSIPAGQGQPSDSNGHYAADTFPLIQLRERGMPLVICILILLNVTMQFKVQLVEKKERLMIKEDTLFRRDWMVHLFRKMYTRRMGD